MSYFRGSCHPFGWHTFRHTYATRIATEGVPEHVLRRLLGHTTSKMTMRYVHVDPATLIATADTVRRALPVPERNGTPVATKPLIALPTNASSTADFRFMNQKTDPVGSASVWSG